MPQRLSRDQWSRYWRKSTITTFSRQFNANYDKEFAEFWNARFAALGDPARIVDLGTGNGAVALLAVQHADDHHRDFEVGGLDYADIRPVQDLAGVEDVAGLLGRIDFRSGVRMEDTGLAAASVDLLTSQYGYEYADTAAAAREAHRVLKPGGRIALILHHDRSSVVEMARDSIAQLRYAQHREKLGERVAALVKAMGESASPAARRRLKFDKRVEAQRKKLNATLARIDQHAPRFRDPEALLGIMVPNLMNVFDAHKDATLRERLAYLERNMAELTAFRDRMADLESAALSEQGIERVQRELETAGFEPGERGVVRYGRDRLLMGWTLVAVRGGD